MKIKKLSDSAINRIAAGEVVERPSSVIKELVENSIDAGATNILVRLELAGKNLILIMDDACGMSKDEILLAVQRHTTSKLNEDDISNIMFFGFRGEALPSIASVSNMKIHSRTRELEKGHIISLSGGEVLEVKESDIPYGTKIEVRDLFFSTPARLKFLKSDRVEVSACLDIIKRISVSFPHIGFTFISDDKELYKVKATDDILERVGDAFGKEFINNSSEVVFEREGYRITGYTSIPTYNKSSSSDQFLYVNKRPVKDKLLNVALRVAYQDYISRDRHPISVIFIESNPRYVDVNVHPAKTEIRFREANEIRGMLISSIKDALGRGGNNSSTDLSNKILSSFSFSNQAGMESNLLAKDAQKKFGNYSPPSGAIYNRMSSSAFLTRDPIAFDDAGPSAPYRQNFGANIPLPLERNIAPQVNQDKIEIIATRGDADQGDDRPLESRRWLGEQLSSTGAYHFVGEERRSCSSTKPGLDSRGLYPMGAAIAQFHSSYIISQTEDGIIIVDQHAAHERLVYERIKKDLLSKNLPSQRLMIPVIVEFENEFLVDNLFEKSEELASFGLVVQKMNDKTAVVREVPSLLGNFDVEKLIKDLADNLSEIGENIALQELIEHVTETYACHYSIRAGRSLNISEMNDLLREMENNPFSGQCNHGRPTYIKLSLSEVEKLFGRR